MSYTYNFTFTFQNLPGLTLNAAIYDAANPTPNQVGDLITTGFTDLGYGSYSFWATLPDGHVGSFVVWDSAQLTRRIAMGINPQDAENNDAKTSSRASQTSVDTVAGYVDTEVTAIKAKTDNLPSDPASTSGLATAHGSGSWATATGFATPTNVTDAQAAITNAISALHNLSTTDIDNRLTAYDGVTQSDLNATQTAITTAIGALNNLSATDAAAAIAAYLLMGAKSVESTLLDVWAVIVGNATANDATNPTSISYQNPTTGGQVTHILTDTTRVID